MKKVLTLNNPFFQDVGDVTLTSAAEYSPIVENIFNQTIVNIEEYVGGIVRMRRMIREAVLDRIEPSQVGGITSEIWDFVKNCLGIWDFVKKKCHGIWYLVKNDLRFSDKMTWDLEFTLETGVSKIYLVHKTTEFCYFHVWDFEM